jgi:predicted 2-oxoglutarate/Fe(II)-dependent dioxygenase YbiX
MKKDLDFYIKKHSNFLTTDICIKTIEELKNTKWKENKFYDPKSNTTHTLSGNLENDYSFDNKISTHNLIMEKLWIVVKNYIDELNFPWFVGWQGYTELRFNRYYQNKKMAEHCDHINSIFDGQRKGIPTLSIVGSLNDDYEGGDFIMFEDKKIDIKQGELIIFPSLFLYPHRVEPVIKGTRYSYVSWVY